MEYPNPSVDFPKKEIMISEIRRPNPDLTTALATRNATKISRMNPLENPEYASAVVSVLVKIVVTKASTDATKTGKAPIIIEKMVVIKIAKRCQAFS
jgi:hypothetical protein